MLLLLTTERDNSFPPVFIVKLNESGPCYKLANGELYMIKFVAESADQLIAHFGLEGRVQNYLLLVYNLLIINSPKQQLHYCNMQHYERAMYSNTMSQPHFIVPIVVYSMLCVWITSTTCSHCIMPPPYYNMTSKTRFRILHVCIFTSVNSQCCL